MMIKKLLGRKIKHLRKENSLSQEQFAEIIGISVRNLSKIETGQTFPSAQNLEKIINSLKITPKELFNFQYQETQKIIIENLIKNIKNNPEKIENLYKIIKSIIN